MKNFFKIASVAIIALTANTIFAQTATTDLKVTVGNVYSISVSQPEVSILMNSPAHFQNGNSSAAQTNHVKVTATGAYKVTVQANSDLQGPSSQSIPVNTVAIMTQESNFLGAGNNPNVAASVVASQQLSTSAPTVPIITSPAGDFQAFDVTYKISAENAPLYLNKAAGTYAATLTFTLAPN